MAKNTKKDLARSLFITGDYTQKVIADRVGVTEKTMSQWVNAGNWEVQRKSLLTSKKEQLTFLYSQLDAIKKELQEQERAANSKEADSILKLTAAIKNLETESGVGEIIEVFTRFSKWLSKENLKLAQELINYMDGFIQEQID